MVYWSAEPYHLFRYVDEQAFRFNNRVDMNDADRFDMVMRQLALKRLSSNELRRQPDGCSAPAQAI